MNIVNDTPFEVAALPGMGPEGGPAFTIIVKGTFDVGTGGPALPSAEQLPVAYGDEPLGDRGAMRWEADTAPFKPRADVVVVGSAHVPGGQPAPYLDVGVRVGERRVGIRVFGDRVWEKETRASKPVPFTTMELSAERAFGGISPSGGFCVENPLGKGFVVLDKKQDAKGAPLPNIETIEQPVRTWNDHPTPVGLGVYPRSAQPRLGHLGTYDETWRKERSPLPPADFRFDYYNCAYPALQIEGYLRGDEEVEMIHLNPDGRLLFRLPAALLQVEVQRFDPSIPGVAGGVGQEDSTPAGPPTAAVDMVLDTLLLLPEEGRFALAWRGHCLVADLDVPEIETVILRLRG
ncbi:MAG: DUF2169 domain-containing protein [Nitrospirota bacterium]|jgi:hypothetical protein